MGDESLICVRCNEAEGTVECRTCTQPGEPIYKLCNDCNSIIHDARGVYGKHAIVSLHFKRRKEEIMTKFQEFDKKTERIVSRKQTFDEIRKELDDRLAIQERYIRESVTAIHQKLKQKALHAISQLKEYGAKRKLELDKSVEMFDKRVSEMHEIRTACYNCLTDSRLVEHLDEVDEMLNNGMQFVFDGVLDTSDIHVALDLEPISQAIEALEIVVTEKPEPDVPVSQSNDTSTRDDSDVYVQSVISKSGAFWVQPRMSSEMYRYLEGLSLKIRCHHVTHPDWLSLAEAGEVPSKGFLCYAQYQEDNKWYRGLVEETSNYRGKKGAMIRFADFGNIEFIPYSNILPAFEGLLPDLPYQAVQCCLFGSETLPTEARWFFNDLVKNEEMDCKFEKQLNVDPDGTLSVWQVKLTKKDGQCVNDLVKEKVETHNQPKSSIACRDIRLLENPDLLDRLTDQDVEEKGTKSESSHSDVCPLTPSKTNTSSTRSEASPARVKPKSVALAELCNQAQKVPSHGQGDIHLNDIDKSSQDKLSQSSAEEIAQQVVNTAVDVAVRALNGDVPKKDIEVLEKEQGDLKHENDVIGDTATVFTNGAGDSNESALHDDIEHTKNTAALDEQTDRISPSVTYTSQELRKMEREMCKTPTENLPANIPVDIQKQEDSVQCPKEDQYPLLATLAFIPGNKYRMRVGGGITENGTFLAVHDPEDPNVYEQLEKFYADINASAKKAPPCGDIITDQNVLVRMADVGGIEQWMRAVVLREDSTTVSVRLLDFGTDVQDVITIDRSAVRKLPWEFSSVPHQAVACSLRTDAYQHVSDRARNTFRNMVADKQITVEVIHISTDGCIPYVRLFCGHTSVGQTLYDIDEKPASPHPKSPVPHLFRSSPSPPFFYQPTSPPPVLYNTSPRMENKFYSTSHHQQQSGQLGSEEYDLNMGRPLRGANAGPTSGVHQHRAAAMEGPRFQTPLYTNQNIGQGNRPQYMGNNMHGTRMQMQGHMMRPVAILQRDRGQSYAGGGPNIGPNPGLIQALGALISTEQQNNIVQQVGDVNTPSPSPGLETFMPSVQQVNIKALMELQHPELIPTSQPEGSPVNQGPPITERQVLPPLENKDNPTTSSIAGSSYRAPTPPDDSFTNPESLIAHISKHVDTNTALDSTQTNKEVLIPSTDIPTPPEEVHSDTQYCTGAESITSPGSSVGSASILPLSSIPSNVEYPDSDAGTGTPSEGFDDDAWLDDEDTSGKAAAENLNPAPPSTSGERHYGRKYGFSRAPNDDYGRRPHREERPCYSCGQVGHFAKNCPLGVKKPARSRVSRGYRHK